MYKIASIVNGCTFGYYVKAFRNLNYKAYGIDVLEYTIRRAKKDKTIDNSEIKNQINVIDDNLMVIPYSVPEAQSPILYTKGYDNALYAAYLSEFTNTWDKAEEET
jgi:hypothetical protein